MRFSATLVAAALIIVQTSGESAEDSFTSGAYSPQHVNFNEIFSNSLSMLADDSVTSVTKDDDFHLISLPSQFSEFRLQSYTTPPMETTTPQPTTTPPPRMLLKDTINDALQQAKKKSSPIVADKPLRLNAGKLKSFGKNVMDFEMHMNENMMGPKSRFLKAAYLRPTLDRRYFRITNRSSTTITTTTPTTTTKPATTTETTSKVVNVVPLQQPRGVLDLILPASRVRNFKDVFETFRRMLSYTFRK